MKPLSAKVIRATWLEFFQSKGHKVLPSSSLVPIDDDSLLWINSGVATLKPYFTGKKLAPAPRLTNSQKSLRTNDIQNVGITARHQTLFEMLGNFSIGDYFRKEALTWAYELLFDVFELPKSQVFVTYFEEDLETYQTWLSLGIAPDHLIKGSRKTNFWDVGQGPCGPCTEIYFDRGFRYDKTVGGLDLLINDEENDRYIEIWNIVFSQYNNDGQSNYSELSQKNIDTGAGLERLAMVMQEVSSNFDTDLFKPIITEIQKYVALKYVPENYFVPNQEQSQINLSFRITADHVRAVACAIQDGVLPSNSHRGYIIRRLIRRAYYAMASLGATSSSFLYLLVPSVASALDYYEFDVVNISQIIRQEEEIFARTIKRGQALLDEEIAHCQGEFDPEVAFKLFETYGFPIDLTKDILAKHRLTLDLTRVEELVDEHANISRQKQTKGLEMQIQTIQNVKRKISEFVGYDQTKIVSDVIYRGQEGKKFYTLFTQTPFYATSGGQHCDVGTINGVPIIDVFVDKHGNNWHVSEVPIPGDVAELVVDTSLRLAKSQNHSATHLLGAALRSVLGKNVVQLGSDNNHERLRFDFPHPTKLTLAELKRVENLVQDYIAQNYQCEIKLLTLAAAKQEPDLVLLSGEEYRYEQVRMVAFGPISKELCGGTHVSTTGVIESFKILKCEAKGAQIFRIEALTSFERVNAYMQVQVTNLHDEASRLAKKIKALDEKFAFDIANDYENLLLQISSLQTTLKNKQKQSNEILQIDFEVSFQAWHATMAFIKLDLDQTTNLKMLVLKLRDAHPQNLIIIGQPSQNGQMSIAVSSKTINVLPIFKAITDKFQGKGGGKQDFAMGTCQIFEIGDL